jgi:general secretion pathway protein D
MVPVLRPLLPSYGHLVAYSDTNALIITDHASNVGRLTNIVRRLDKPTQTGAVEVVPLVHASAKQMAETLSQLYSGKKKGDSSSMSVLPDPRTNNLIIKADEATRTELKKLAQKLDSPTGSEGNVRVMYLENADAENLVKVLQEVVSKQSGKKGGGGRGEVALHADKQTNAVVVRASKSAFQTIEKVVDRLDVRRLQVYVEALIAEVSSERAREFGIQWQATEGLSGNNRGAIGGTSFTLGDNIQDVAQNPAATGSGLSLGYVDGSLEVGGEEILALGGLVRALETDSDSNVLSTPNILTMDNQEAEIVVGQNVPFVTGSYSQTNNDTNATNPFQTIERKDVGLTLRLTPQITEGSSVKMDIYQEVSSVTRQASNAADIITNKRSLDTTVVAENGEMIVLGGLIKTDRSTQQQMVPLLGRIPLLGSLFRYQTMDKQKTNLMVFLRPKIIRKNADMADPTTDKYQFLNRLREQQRGTSESQDPPPLEQWERIGPGTPTPEPAAEGGE